VVGADLVVTLCCHLDGNVVQSTSPFRFMTLQTYRGPATAPFLHFFCYIRRCNNTIMDVLTIPMALYSIFSCRDNYDGHITLSSAMLSCMIFKVNP